MNLHFFAPCPPGAESVLEKELLRAGGGGLRAGFRGVSFLGDLNTAYRASLELRTASRILLQLISENAADENEIYRLVSAYPWESEFDSQHTIACRVTGVPKDKDPRFANLRLKDGIVDRFRRAGQSRPNIDRHNPDVRIEARWDGKRVSVFLNWSGAPLHERGYRLERTDAVLRETTAAAVVSLAGWEKMAREGASFVDPVCGSGTLLAEAAFIAMDAPPSVHRKDWGFHLLKRHNEEVWQNLVNEGRIRFGKALDKLPPFFGYDIDPDALAAARSNLRRAGLSQAVRLEQHDITAGRPSSWPMSASGLLCADPPYGVRSGGDPQPVYKALGDLFRELDSGWRMSLLAPDKKTASGCFLRAGEYLKTVSGGMDVVLALYSRLPGKPGKSGKPEKPEKPHFKPFSQLPPPDPKAPSLKKLLKKKLQALGRWADKTGVTSYRIWDADMPEFNAAVDWYEGKWLHVQEFEAPRKVPEEKALRRLFTLLDVLKELTGCSDENLYLKTRRRGVRPYGKPGDSSERFIIRENGRRFFVNFNDYLDSGIFLDHRSTRARIEGMAAGKTFLNLFCYTGSATVMAASGGALRSVSVDVSNTYLKWSRDNLKLNKLSSSSHQFVRADAFDFLKNDRNFYDLVFIDPPTYSNGSGRRDWSVQEHHAPLLRLALSRLKEDGCIIFSVNFRRFVLDRQLAREYRVREITQQTVPPDFVGRGGAHRCWEIRKK
ncbi:MAG: bifunctional 23S rRNA (guanine(2069)-N(7))-methyltransferase RlmK/23S rRNA (guanine(2445)-N(2))-methyltransferase RlmL [Spirochaetales bacterium]|nr:MAG: bifunctional 23S rRNA (guanine(2069)-N(7))-methyltransferase RlmK/23S rRNA (guanine(2445)-N(2))-methyltransferase RlmL [Spirochaetales bacterium]